MSFDYGAGRFWFGIGQYLIAGAIGIYAWFSNKQKAQARDVAQVKADLAVFETRVIKLESSAITHKELGKVYNRINEVSEQVSEMSGSVKSIESALDRIQEHLMKNGG